MPNTVPHTCELCGRATAVTRHHLIPRTRHRNKRMRRHFSLAQMQQRILWVCRSCHNHIHHTFSEKELAERYHDRECLIAHPEIRRFVDWIKSKPAGFKATSSRRRR